MADVYELKDVLIGDVQHLGRDSDIFQVALGLVQTLEACVGIVYGVTNKKRVFFRESVPFLVFCRPLDVLEDLVELVQGGKLLPLLDVVSRHEAFESSLDVQNVVPVLVGGRPRQPDEGIASSKGQRRRVSLVEAVQGLEHLMSSARLCCSHYIL